MPFKFNILEKNQVEDKYAAQEQDTLQELFNRVSKLTGIAKAYRRI